MQTSAVRVTHAHVQLRHGQFADAFARALKTLGYSADDACERVAQLRKRLANSDFKLYGTEPVHYLHAGKRVTRALIKFAIQGCPAELRRRDALRQQYNKRVAAERALNPHANFFSFEAAYAGKLRVDLSAYKKLFCI